MWFVTQESIIHILLEISVEIFKTPLSLSTTTTNARVLSITSYSLFLYLNSCCSGGLLQILLSWITSMIPSFEISQKFITLTFGIVSLIAVRAFVTILVSRLVWPSLVLMFLIKPWKQKHQSFQSPFKVIWCPTSLSSNQNVAFFKVQNQLFT
jgi:hypothetical protein